MKDRLPALFGATVRDLDPGPPVRRALAERRAHLQAPGRVLLIAFGKAARPMAEAALLELQGLRVDGLLVVPQGQDAPLPPLEVVAAGHPLPDAGSLRAGARALELCSAAAADTAVVFLVSGGGSSLCELPLDAAASVDEWRTFYRALVGCGAGIEAVNAVRKHLSAIKGGRLGAAAGRAAVQLTLAVVDVPGAGLAALASGPTVGDDGSLELCRATVRDHRLEGALPDAMLRRLETGDLPAPIRSDDPRLLRSTAVRLLDNDVAKAALAARAEAAGMRVVVDSSADELPCDEAATRLLERLERETGPGPVAVVAGGEVRVALPDEPGTGGRNQQFVLTCALRIQGRGIAVLSCGTDGVDGNSTAAGAVADGTTVPRARALGLDAEEHLRRCDATPLFQALGDAVMTGPTGTNVRDLRLLVRE